MKPLKIQFKKRLYVKFTSHRSFFSQKCATSVFGKSENFTIAYIKTGLNFVQKVKINIPPMKRMFPIVSHKTPIVVSPPVLEIAYCPFKNAQSGR